MEAGSPAWNRYLVQLGADAYQLAEVVQSVAMVEG
jgi:hypothetical protein